MCDHIKALKLLIFKSVICNCTVLHSCSVCQVRCYLEYINLINNLLLNTLEHFQYSFYNNISITRISVRFFFLSGTHEVTLDSRKVCVTNSPEHLCDIYIHVNSCLLVWSWQVTHQTIRCLYHLISHESALCCISYNCQFSFFSLKVANLYVLQRRLCISLFTLF